MGVAGDQALAELANRCARDPKFCPPGKGPGDITIDDLPAGARIAGGDSSLDLLETISGAAIGAAVGGALGGGAVGGGAGGSAIANALTDALTGGLSGGGGNIQNIFNLLGGLGPSAIGGGYNPGDFGINLPLIFSKPLDVGGFGGGALTLGPQVLESARTAAAALASGRLDISSLLLGGGGGGVFNSLFRTGKLIFG